MVGSKPPNIVLVVLDTVRRGSLDLYGCPLPTMPEFSRWASKEAVVFERAYACAPWTLPSHASLFTGLLPSEHGVISPNGRLVCQPTVASELHERGYETVGVSGNVYVGPAFGLDAGFESFWGAWQAWPTREDFDPAAEHLIGGGWDPERRPVRLRLARPTALANAFYGRWLWKRYDYGARRVNGLVRGWLRRRPRSQPFFLFVNYLDAHYHYWAPEPWRMLFVDERDRKRAAAFHDRQGLQKFVAGRLRVSEEDFAILRGLYHGEFRYLDVRLMELLADLDRSVGLDDCLVVVTSDHGENIGEGSLWGHHYSVNERLAAVPLVVRFPSGLGAGTRVAHLVSLVGIRGFLLEQADRGPGRTEFHPQDGASGRSHVVVEYPTPVPSPAVIKRRFGFFPPQLDRGLTAIVTAEGLKYVATSAGGEHLFDLKSDPEELRDLAPSRPKVCERLRRLLPREPKPADDSGYAWHERHAIAGRLRDLGYIE